MSVLNATLMRVDAPNVDGGGNVTFTSGAALNVRCSMCAVKNSQRFELGAVIADATAAMYVRKSALAAGFAIEKGYRIVAQQDTEAQKTYVIVWRTPQIKDSLSHHELFLQVQ